MLLELIQDDTALTASLRTIHALCDEHNDAATVSLVENWTDEAEHGTWFVHETCR
jgi:starvation-inducible DNA-binding protein